MWFIDERKIRSISENLKISFLMKEKLVIIYKTTKNVFQQNKSTIHDMNI